jgi:hypothetical protein
MQSVRHTSHCLPMGAVLRSRRRRPDGQWIQHVIVSQKKAQEALQFYALRSVESQEAGTVNLFRTRPSAMRICNGMPM